MKIKSALIFLLWPIISLLVGVGVFFISGAIAQRFAQDALVHQGRIIASSINPSRINSLTGEPGDQNNPDYTWLVEQFTHMAGVYPEIRYVYLMGQNENKEIFFYVDSQPEKYHGKDVPPLAIPGEIYDDVNPEFAKVFDRSGPTVWPAVTDKWGTFVSLTIPVNHPNLNKKVVLGVDIDAGVWQQQIIVWQVGPAVTAFVLSLILLAFAKTQRLNYLARKKIAENEQLFGAIVEVARDAIVMMDDKGNTVLWNKAAEEIFGYKAEEVLGKKFHELIVTSPQHRDDKHILEFGRTGESDTLGKTLELPVRRKDGTAFTIELTVARTKQDNRWYAVGVARDITARKQTEIEMKKHTDELERMNQLMIDRELRMVELKKQLEKKNA